MRVATFYVVENIDEMQAIVLLVFEISKVYCILY